MKLLGRKRSRSKSRMSMSTRSGGSYKRRGVIVRRRKTPLLGPGARQIYAKCRTVTAFQMAVTGLGPNTVNQVRIAIPWQRPKDTSIPLAPTAPLGQYIYQPNCFSTGRFAAMWPIYQEYAITGVKIEYRPTGIMPTEVNADMVTNAAYNVGIDDYEANVTEPDFGKLIQLPGFKAVRARSVWTKFISFKKISKSEHLNWQPCGNAEEPSAKPYGSVALTQAWSMLTLLLGGPANRFNLGFMKLTWYVKFRGQN